MKSKELSVDQLQTNKRKAQLRLAEIIPTGEEARILSTQISTIDNILNGKRIGLDPSEALLKKKLVGNAKREFIKKPDYFV